MIVSKCPLRIALAGGCTDLQAFIDEYGKGSVINFAISLYTHVTINYDSFGLSSKEHKYIVNYSRREEEENINNIHNDIARECFKYFNTGPNTSSLTADIFSTGSGLASSSSYLISFIKALLLRHGMRLSNENVCGLAINIERKFNPLTGYQDPYGCGTSGLKRLDIHSPNVVKVTPLNSTIFKNINMHLVHSGVYRNSTKILERVDVSRCKNLLPLVDEMETALSDNNLPLLMNVIREGWTKKKESSSFIVRNTRVRELDDLLGAQEEVLAHRLCGAGNGGFFLTFSNKNWSPSHCGLENKSLEINISNKGPQATEV